MFQKHIAFQFFQMISAIEWEAEKRFVFNEKIKLKSHIPRLIFVSGEN